MIYKNCDYGVLSNVTVAEFGYGTVHMNNAKLQGKFGDVRFESGKGRYVGEVWESTKEDVNNTEIVFRFHNEASINALIEQLKDLKAFMNEEVDK